MGEFTLEFKNLSNVRIAIYDILGNLVYTNTTNASSIHIQNDSRFKSGVYLIKVVADNQKTYHTKLVIK